MVKRLKRILSSVPELKLLCPILRAEHDCVVIFIDYRYPGFEKNVLLFVSLLRSVERLVDPARSLRVLDGDPLGRSHTSKTWLDPLTNSNAATRD